MSQKECNINLPLAIWVGLVLYAIHYHAGASLLRDMYVLTACYLLVVSMQLANILLPTLTKSLSWRDGIRVPSKNSGRPTSEKM